MKYMKKLFITLLVLVIGLSLNANDTLIVGVKNAPPFIIKTNRYKSN